MGSIFSSDDSEEEQITDLRHCNIYRFHRSRPNKTWLMGISSQEYEGIPENLVVNLVTTFILAIIFIVVRRSTGKHNYGRMSINIVEDLEPTDALHDGDVVDYNDAGPEVVAVGQNLSIQNTPSRIVAKEPYNEAESNIARPKSTHVAPEIIKLARKQENTTDLEDIGYFSWIRMVLTMPDRLYLEKCGADCVTYLSFQRHLILLAIFITGTSLLIILPMNMYLEKHVYSSNFGATIINKTKISGFAKLTIINLDENHAYCFWAHTILANAYVFLGIAVMKRFSKQVCILPEDSTVISTTICIIGLKQTQRQGGVIRTFFCSKFPDLEILEVSFAYNVSKLRKFEAERMRAQSAKEFHKKRHEAAIKSEGETQAERPKIRPYPLGIIGCCFGCKCWGIFQCKKVDAIDYYTAREASFYAKVEEERRHALSKPLGIAYITFSSVEAAELVVDAFSRCSRRFAKSNSGQLNTVSWTVSFAPAPEEINWHNISVNVVWWWIRCVLVNNFVMLLVFLYSTPLAILGNGVPSFLNSRNQTDNIWDKMAHTFLNTVPSLSVCILGSTLIIIVNQSDLLIGYWTKTAAHLSEMLKEYVFLFIMICLLPGLGIKTLFSFFFGFFEKPDLRCIFFPENGATFVKYVCTSSLCGVIVELIRVPTTFLYAVRIFFARSVAEKDAIRKEMVSEFPMGYSYARVILHFTLFSCYSVIYPLITPFGLLYFIAKHFVDRYHLYFSYKPCKVEKKIHSTAIYLLLFSLWLLHLNLFIYIIVFDLIRELDPSYVKDDNNYHLWAVKLVLMMGFCFTTAIYLGQRYCKVCIDFSYFHYSGKSNRVTDEKQSKEQKTVEEQSNVTEFADEGSMTRVTNDGPQSIHGSTYKMGAGTDVGRATEGTSRTVANNYVEGGQPFGRYIAPLLRPEFVRHAQSAPSRVESS